MSVYYILVVSLCVSTTVGRPDSEQRMLDAQVVFLIGRWIKHVFFVVVGFGWRFFFLSFLNFISIVTVLIIVFQGNAASFFL